MTLYKTTLCVLYLLIIAEPCDLLEVSITVLFYIKLRDADLLTLYVSDFEVYRRKVYN